MHTKNIILCGKLISMPNCKITNRKKCYYFKQGSLNGHNIKCEESLNDKDGTSKVFSNVCLTVW